MGYLSYRFGVDGTFDVPELLLPGDVLLGAGDLVAGDDFVGLAMILLLLKSWQSGFHPTRSARVVPSYATFK